MMFGCHNSLSWPPKFTHRELAHVFCFVKITSAVKYEPDYELGLRCPN